MGLMVKPVKFKYRFGERSMVSEISLVRYHLWLNGETISMVKNLWMVKDVETIEW